MNKKLMIGISTSIVLLIASTITLWQMYQQHEASEIIYYPVHEHIGKQHQLSLKNFKTSATLSAVGDILIHGVVYKAARSQNGYDFKPMLASVKPYLESADITFANQETMLGGEELGLSTYPLFNSPYEVGDALQDSGIDIVSISNNHTIDRGVKAVQNATKFYNDIGLLYTGAYQSEEDSVVIRTIKRNGITFSFLAYTYGTNGMPIPKDHPYIVNLIELSKIKHDITKAKEISDVVVVSLHFGNEYQRLPSKEQKNIATEVVSYGADIILGHHPHVLQPMEWIETDNGHKGFVIYSLGNFLSGQRSIYREIGGILTLTVQKEINNGQASISVENPEFISTYVSRANGFKVVPLKEASKYGLADALNIHVDIHKHMYQFVPDTQLAQAH